MKVTYPHDTAESNCICDAIARIKQFPDTLFDCKIANPYGVVTLSEAVGAVGAELLRIAPTWVGAIRSRSEG